MHLLLKLALFVFPSLGQSSNIVEPKPNPQIILKVNTPYPITIESNKSIFIKDTFLKVRHLNNKPILISNTHGSTLLKKGLESIDVQVLNNEDWSSYEQFIKLYQHHPSLKIKYQNNIPFIYGEILIEQDLIQILNWAKDSKKKPSFDIQILDPNLKESCLNLLSKILGFYILDFDNNFKLTLKSPPSEEQLKVLSTYNFSILKNEALGHKIGNLDILFINITNNELKTLSPLLPSSFQWTLENKIKILSQIFTSDYSQIETLNKKSSIINLMLFENEKTEYQSGGEFAIQQRSLYNNSLQWKNYGLFIDALPTTIDKNKLKLDLKIKISHVTSMDQSQPSLSQDLWRQNLVLNNNEVLIVSNTVTNILAQNKTQNLILKSIPILGHLFYGKTRSNENSNVFMVLKFNPRSIYEN